LGIPAFSWCKPPTGANCTYGCGTVFKVTQGTVTTRVPKSPSSFQTMRKPPQVSVVTPSGTLLSSVLFRVP
jgi:hypothetical protein